jgi:hypothetical protein
VGRLKQIKVGLDALTEARLTVRAERSSASVSEYVRGLIVRDLSAAGGLGGTEQDPATAAPGSLGVQLLELGLVTGILVRAQLGRAMGEEEARRVEARARQKAAEQLDAILDAADLESVS